MARSKSNSKNVPEEPAPPAGVLIKPSDDSVSDFLWKKLTDSAKTCLLVLRQATNDADNAPKTPQDSKDPVPESPWKQKVDFYSSFVKPKGYTVINRSFLPTSFSEDSVLKTAMANLPPAPTDDEVSNMQALIKEVKDAVLELADSKLELHFSSRFREQNIKFGKGTVQNTGEAWKAWKKEKMSKEKCEQYFTVLFESANETEVIDKFEFEIMSELKLWYSSIEDSFLDKTKRSGGKLRAGCIRHWILNKLRDTFRGKFQKKVLTPPHGITLRFSRPGTRGLERRVKGEFSFEEFVQGWDDQVVANFNASLKKKMEAKPKANRHAVKIKQEEDKKPAPKTHEEKNQPRKSPRKAARTSKPSVDEGKEHPAASAPEAATLAMVAEEVADDPEAFSLISNIDESEQLASPKTTKKNIASIAAAVVTKAQKDASFYKNQAEELKKKLSTEKKNRKTIAERLKASENTNESTAAAGAKKAAKKVIDSEKKRAATSSKSNPKKKKTKKTNDNVSPMDTDDTTADKVSSAVDCSIICSLFY